MNKFLLDIVVPTYNRPECIAEYIKEFSNAKSSNCRLLIFDSSIDNRTEEICKSSKVNNCIYYKFSSNIDVDKKTILSMKRAEARYIWLCSDTRLANIETVQKEINFLNETAEIILLYPSKEGVNENYNREKKGSFFVENFFRLTTYGATICRKDLIDKFDTELLVKNFGGKGFIYPCSLVIYSDGIYKILSGNFLNKLSFNCESGWIKAGTAMGIWTKNLQESLYKLEDYLSISSIQQIIRNRGKCNNMFSKRGLIRLRASNNFSVKIYKKYKPFLLQSLNCSKFSAIFIALMPKLVCFIICNIKLHFHKLKKSIKDEV